MKNLVKVAYAVSVTALLFFGLGKNKTHREYRPKINHLHRTAEKCFPPNPPVPPHYITTHKPK